MSKQKKETLKDRRNNPLYNHGMIWNGNGKLLDWYDEVTGINFRYAQYNTRAIEDCPFRSAGCELVCYATKGNHRCPSVKESRADSYEQSKRADFSESIIYSIETEKLSKRYKEAVMIVRIHESGDFYSVQYLRKWVAVFEYFTDKNGVQFVFYTKSFPFFLMLNNAEAEVINNAMKAGILSINLSLDDTTSREQKIAYLKMIARFPLCNTYYCTENVEAVEHDDICECENCAKCGTCNKAQGKKTVVKIHSASRSDMEGYRENIMAEG